MNQLPVQRDIPTNKSIFASFSEEKEAIASLLTACAPHRRHAASAEGFQRLKERNILAVESCLYFRDLTLSHVGSFRAMDRTLHTILADRLAQDIREGRYPPGSMLPSEVDLARSNGLSRGTVRAALAALESDGLIDRRRGSGTRVLEGPAPSGFGQTVAKIDDLIQYARNTRRVVHSVKEIVLDRPLANLLGAEAGSRWIHIENLRIDPAQPQRPLCAVNTYLRAELAQATSLLAEETVAICDLIERTSGVRTAEIEQEFQATFVPEELAKALNAPAGAAALRILRRYLDASGWLFETSVSLHPADRFAYRMRLRRPG